MNRPAGSGSVRYVRGALGGSWEARAPQQGGKAGRVLGRFDTRARAEQALTRWVAEQVAAVREGRDV